MNKKNVKKLPKKRLFGTSIGVKLLACVFCSLCLSIALFFGLYFVSSWAVEKYSSTMYASNKLSEFQSYVERSRLTVDDFSRLTSWINKNDIKFMHIYRGTERIFNSDDPVDDSYVYDEREQDYYWDNRGINFIKSIEYVRKKPTAVDGTKSTDSASDIDPTGSDQATLPTEPLTDPSDLPQPDTQIGLEDLPYPLPGASVLFSDREEEVLPFDELYDEHVTYEMLNVFIAVGTDMRLMMLFIISAAFVSLIVFALLILRFSRSRVMYMIDLSHEVAQIEAGMIDKSVTVKGRDEIATLAQNVDDMRLSLVERLQSEKEAHDANRELITAMSHDLRTPLSALIGYLEIINSGVYSSEEQKQIYLQKTLEKSYQIKAMSDKLFDYFTVFKNDKADALTMEEYDGHALLTQMIGEQTYMLEEKGFQIVFEGLSPDGDDLPEPYRLILDSEALLRVFDNIYSNILKYADPSEPVKISLQTDGADVRVTVSNRIARVAGKVASTRIGLKSCRRLMMLMGGSFRTESDGKNYSVVLQLKKVPDALIDQADISE